MLEELFNLVKSVATEAGTNTAEVPQEHNDAVVAEATNTVASGLRNIVAGGGAQNLLSLFGSGGNTQQSGGGLLSNPIVSMMIGHFAGKLMSKFNLGAGQANNVASSLIPNVINGLVNKTNDPGNNNFSLDKLLNSITGGKAAEATSQQSGGGLQDILNQLGGNQGGGNGISDIISKLAGGAQEQQQRNGGGGLMDLIKGFIK
ncbi:MAG: hypothetical protein ABI288_00805 [Ginsengibacter sp.]